jgi:hypothetical protein
MYLLGRFGPAPSPNKYPEETINREIKMEALAILFGIYLAYRRNKK